MLQEPKARDNPAKTITDALMMLKSNYTSTMQAPRSQTCSAYVVVLVGVRELQATAATP